MLLQLKNQFDIVFGRIICAWCGKDLGHIDGDGDTHGICKDCLKRELEKV